MGRGTRSAETGSLRKSLGQAQREGEDTEKKPARHRRGPTEISQKQRPWEQAHRQA